MYSKDAEIQKLRKENEEQKILMRGFMEIFGEEIVKKAVEKFNIQIVKTSGIPLTPIEALREIGEMKARKEKEEYEKLLANGNGDNGQ